MKEDFADGVSNKCDGSEDWCGLKRKLLDVVSEVCGCTKNKPRHFKTWRWNKDVDLKGYGKRARMTKIGRNIVRQKRC